MVWQAAGERPVEEGGERAWEDTRGGLEAGVVRVGRRVLAGGRETEQRRLGTEGGGQRHERVEGLERGIGVVMEFLQRRLGLVESKGTR